MRMFSFFSGSPKRKPIANKARPTIEMLEDRSTPSVTTISGFVYDDVNHNNLFDAGEKPIANSSIVLKNDQNVVIGSTTTDANGYYQFTHDNSVPQAPQTLTKEVVFPPTQTNFDLQGALDQFDPNLGDLQSVEITYDGSITSTIKVENTSPTSTSNIQGKVAGTIHFSAANADQTLNVQDNAGSFSAGIFDGAIDFGGASGSNFGQQTASGSQSLTLTGGDMNAYIGTGTVNVTAHAEASSFAQGGGNLDAEISSSGQGKMTVTYHYIPTPAIKPGNYTIVQTVQPAGYTDGHESQNGVVLNTAIGDDFIPVTVTGPDLPNNNFGELVTPASLSGHVFEDANNNGTFDPGEVPIANASVMLTGTDDLGAAVLQNGTTDANGFYHFDDLRPGTYAIAESQPANYLDGKDAVGTKGGDNSVNDQVQNIVLVGGDNGLNYDFGEIKPASLSGFVYHDANDNGVKDAGESGIAGTTVTLSGQSQGGAVQVVGTTDANGFYQFDNLYPGTYALNETQPAGWKDGKDAAGNLGGAVANDAISSIIVAAGAAGTDYDFGEKEPPVADLAIVKEAHSQSVLVGSLLSYTLTVTNNGPGTGVNVVVTDQLPPGVTLVDAHGAGWAITNGNGQFTATRPTMASGEVDVIEVTIQAPLAAGSLTNTSSVTNDTPDPNPGNNTSTVTTPVVDNPGNVFAKDVLPLGTPVIRSKVDLLVGPGAPGPDIQATFVDGTVRTLMGRAATVDELDTYIADLNSGGLTRQQLVANLASSDEALAIQANRLYQAYLDRLPNAGEQGALINQLKTGSQNDAIIGLLSSQEYQDTHPGETGLVAGFSADILGHTPSTSGMLLGAQAMANETVQDYARNLLATSEALANQIDTAYHLALRRAASASEIGYWTTRMQQQKMSEADLVTTLLASDEFYQLALSAAQHA
ncbi:MAG: SdrD B-like domain-containing protein [Gemmataceae bacterium]